MTNSGLIEGNTGLYLNESGGTSPITEAEVENSGEIKGEGSAIVVDDGTILVANSGLLSGNDLTIDTATDATLVLTNSGIVESRAAETAVLGGNTTDMIINTGQILGDVEMRDGDDMFVTNGAGVTTGDILLEDGNDMAIGGASGDRISGGGDDDVIFGGGGVDELDGGAGLDILLGGTGTDTITGGTGGDFLLGEDGADVFLFTSASDSTTADPDSILDFERGEDIIDLYTITDTLQFIGNDDFSVTGQNEIRVREIGGVLTVAEVDLGGNGSIDMEIIIYGAVDMDRADFGL